jgi:phage tail-like protein
MTHRFGVFFLVGGTRPNFLDIRFQDVSGLQAAIQTKPDPSAASSLCKKMIPTGIDFADLELKRGLVVGSPLVWQIQSTFNDFKFMRSDVLITVYSEMAIPMVAYILMEAYPIAWQINPLSARSEDILIENLKLSYTRMRIVGV